MGGGLEAHNCTGVERERRLATLENIESARHAPQQPQYEICQTCGGEGSLYDYTDDEVVECHVCKGTGKHRTVR